jgi:ESX secretion-associated protein EspG
VLCARAWQSLWDKDYGTPDDVEGALEWCLRALAAPEWEVDARFHLSEGPRTSVLLASRGRYSVVSTLDSTRLVLRTSEADRLVRDAVALLPDHPPGPGRSITIPAEDLDAAARRAGQDTSALTGELRRRGLESGQAGEIAGVLADVRRFGQFGVGRTRRGGTRARAAHVVSFYDTSEARFSFTRKRGGVRDWVTLVGADGYLLARQIEEAREQLA